MTYTILVDYASSGKAIHAGLDPEQAQMGAGAFLRDLVGLEGRGVRRLTVAFEDGQQETETRDKLIETVDKILALPSPSFDAVSLLARLDRIENMLRIARLGTHA